MKKLLFLLSLVFGTTSFLISQSSEYEKVWELLLNNKREEAKKELLKQEKDADGEYLVLKQLIEQEMGRFRFDKGFIEEMSNLNNFEKLLSVYLKNEFLIGDYGSGWSKDRYDRASYLAGLDYKDQTIKDQVMYAFSHGLLRFGKSESHNNGLKGIGSLRNWEVCGPFENLNSSGLNTEYGPESNFDSNSIYDANSNGRIGWFKHIDDIDPYVMSTYLSEYGASTSYFKSGISIDQGGKYTMKVGTGSKIKIWIDNVLVLNQEENVYTDMDHYIIDLTLNAGNHSILVKLASTSGSYFSVRFFNETDEIINPKSFIPNTVSNDSSVLFEQRSHPTEAYFKDLLKNRKTFSTISLIYFYNRNGEYKKAEPYIKQLKQKYPNSSLLGFLEILQAEYDGEYAKKKEILENIERLDSMYYIPYYYKFSDYSDLNKMTLTEFDEFRNKLRDVTDLNITHLTADFMYALKEENISNIKKQLKPVLREGVNFPKFSAIYIMFYSSLLNDDEKSIKEYREFLSNYYEPQAVTNLSTLYRKKQLKEKHKELYDWQNSIFKNDYSLLRNTASLYSSYQEYEKAREYYLKAQQVFPYSFMNMESLGDCYLQLNKFDDALMWYQKSLTHNASSRSLRKKIENITKKKDPLKSFEMDSYYDYINEKRGNAVPNINGVEVLHEEYNYLLYEEGGYKTSAVEIYEIISENGINILKEYDLELYSNYQIDNMEIVKQDGNVIPAERSGSRGVFNGVGVGDVIFVKYDYTVLNSGRFFNDFYGLHQFGSFVPTEKSIFRVVAPKERILTFDQSYLEIETEESDLGNYRVYKWERNNLDAFPPYENYAPAGADIFPYLSCGTIDDWTDVSNWYSDLIVNQFDEDETVKDAFNSIFPSGFEQYDKLERARKIYKYVTSTCSYSYVSFRQSGFVPQKPGKTIETKLGDCKDFSTLFGILARRAGLDVSINLVLTAEYGEKSMKLPNTDFNHAIARLNIDDKIYFIELTDKNLPFLSLPYSLYGAQVLDVPIYGDTKGRVEIENIAGETRIKDSIILRVIQDVNLEYSNFDMNFTITGAPSSYFIQIFKEDKSYYEEELNNFLSQNYGGDVELDSVIIENMNYNETGIQFRILFKTNEKLQKVGSLYLLPLNLLYKSYTSDLILEERKYDIEYKQYENFDHYDISGEINLSEGLIFDEIPEGFSSSYKKHEYSFDLKSLGSNKLLVNRVFNVNRENIKLEDYDSFKNHVKDVMEVEKTLIGIKKKR